MTFTVCSQFSSPQVKFYDTSLPFDAIKVMIQAKQEISLSNAELGRMTGLDRAQTKADTLVLQFILRPKELSTLLVA